MFAELSHMLRRLRGQIVGWSLGLGLYALFIASFWDKVLGMEGIQEMMDSYPPEMLAFFSSMSDIATPTGFIDTYYFSMMHVIAGIFAVIAGSKLLADDEEKGILDLVLSHPISRSQLFWSRALALATALVAILLAGWLGWYLPSLRSSMDLDALQLLRPFLPLFAELLLFAGLALLFSMALPAARLAGALAGALLVANFLLIGMANLNENLQELVRFTPLHYYQGGRAALGLEWSWFLGLLTAAVLAAVLAWVLFLRRDIRIGGERSWRISRNRPIRPGHSREPRRI